MTNWELENIIWSARVELADWHVLTNRLWTYHVFPGPCMKVLFWGGRMEWVGHL